MDTKPGTEFIKGQLAPYYEQGWEGLFQYTFIPDMNPEAVNGGRGYFLKSGDLLRILESNGETVWQGEVQFVRPRALLFRDRHRLGAGVWSTGKQKGVSYADWVDWFWATPPLQGEFFRNVDA